RGGMKAITDTIKATGQPIILIANDLYELTRRGAALKSLAHTIKFTRVHTRSIPKAIARIAKLEGLEVDPEALEALAERAGGDMRSAVNDLAALATGRTHITLKDVESLGKRDAKGDVWGLLGKVFYGNSFEEARKASWEIDETPENIALWLDENLPLRYESPRDRVEAYKWLSRGDVYLGRVSRRMNYGLWSYANEVMVGGVTTANSEKTVPGMHAFPSWLRRMSQSKGMRELRDRVSRKVGAYTHTSGRVAREDHFPLVRGLMKTDDQFAVWAIVEMDLEADEVAFLLEAKETTARVKKLLAAAEVRKAAAPRAATRASMGGLGSFPDTEAEAAPEPAKPKGRGRKKKAAEPIPDEVGEEPASVPAPAATPAVKPLASKSPAPAPAPEPAPVEEAPAPKAEPAEGPKKQKSLFEF
ncbi:MAG TPA: hypothetical protein VNZ52_10950, partial [Candidatus Thermoplasmatota archaeon]|nr:hypothetical protein [Candidatus Thermoplasmatota archaeon]